MKSNLISTFLAVAVITSIGLLFAIGGATVVQKFIPVTPKSVTSVEASPEAVAADPDVPKISCYGGRGEDGKLEWRYYLDYGEHASYPFTLTTTKQVTVDRSNKGFTILTFKDK